jgi:hypothetical protein
LGNSKGKRVFNIVNKLKFVFVKKTKDGKPRKDVKPTPGVRGPCLVLVIE